MEYNKIFKPETLAKLNKKSAQNLKDLMGNKTLMDKMLRSQELLNEIFKAEKPYRDILEMLAVEMVEKIYPIIEEQGIKIDAKIVDMSSVGQELDEITINKPGNPSIEEIDALIPEEPSMSYVYRLNSLFEKYGIEFDGQIDANQFNKLNIAKKNLFYNELLALSKKWGGINESISPEGRRRIINGITQGAALRGAFSFYMFKEALDDMDDSLVAKYKEIMEDTFGIYDDENMIAMVLSALAQGHKSAGGSSKVIINEIKINKPGKEYTQEDYYKIADYHERTGMLPLEMTPAMWYSLKKKYEIEDDNDNDVPYSGLTESQESGITIRARAICFPMLVHEIIKGLYELVSLQGFKGDKEQNQAVVDKVDTLKNEPHDLKYGKYVYDALNSVFADSQYTDPRIREFFFIEVYQLEDSEFLSFVENALNEEITPKQKQWVDSTLKEISNDLKADDYDATGLDEITINKPLDHYLKKIDSEEQFEETLNSLFKKGYKVIDYFKKMSLEDLKKYWKYPVYLSLNWKNNAPKTIGFIPPQSLKWAKEYIKNDFKTDYDDIDYEDEGNDDENAYDNGF